VGVTHRSRRRRKGHSLVADQRLIDAGEITVVAGFEAVDEAVDDLHHIGVSNVTKWPINIVYLELCLTNRQIEAIVPCLTVERREVVTVAVELDLSLSSENRSTIYRYK